MKAGIVTLSLVFLALTIVRVSFPETITAAKEKLQPVVSYGSELTESILAIGKKLSGNEDAVYAWEKADAPEETAAPASSEPTEGFDLEEMVASNLMGVPNLGGNSFFPPETEDALFETPEPSTEPEPEPLPEPSPEPAVSERELLEGLVAAFLEKQAAITDLALPEAVSTEAVLLDFEFIRPVTAAFSPSFGYRLHPIYGDMRFHYGADFSAYSGDPISAFAAGTVIAAQEFDGYGQTLIIDHGNGFTTLYAHCSVLYVSYGDSVTMGQTIALVGQTGNVTGPHLHFELQKDGKYLNPEFYM